MEHSQPGPPTEKTVRNIRQARAHGLWVGRYHVEFKLWTGQFRVFPRWQVVTTEFFNEGPVVWFRSYWLMLGFSVYRLLPNRRTIDVMNPFFRERPDLDRRASYDHVSNKR